jgi:hypothetical protein
MMIDHEQSQSLQPGASVDAVPPDPQHPIQPDCTRSSPDRFPEPQSPSLVSPSPQNGQTSYPVPKKRAGHSIIEANRRNALRSTGPRTETGRAVSSRNALKHGLTAERIILFDEQRESFERVYSDLIAALKPHGPMEHQLAERIALNAWRLRRAYRVESGLFERARSAWREGATEQTSDVDLVFLRLSTSNDDELGKLSRYEAAIERSLRRALLDLERRQRERR